MARTPFNEHGCKLSMEPTSCTGTYNRATIPIDLVGTILLSHGMTNILKTSSYEIFFFCYSYLDPLLQNADSIIAIHNITGMYIYAVTNIVSLHMFVYALCPGLLFLLSACIMFVCRYVQILISAALVYVSPSCCLIIIAPWR